MTSLICLGRPSIHKVFSVCGRVSFQPTMTLEIATLAVVQHNGPGRPPPVRQPRVITIGLFDHCHPVDRDLAAAEMLVIPCARTASLRTQVQARPVGVTTSKAVFGNPLVEADVQPIAPLPGPPTPPSDPDVDPAGPQPSVLGQLARGPVQHTHPELLG